MAASLKHTFYILSGVDPPLIILLCLIIRAYHNDKYGRDLTTLNPVLLTPAYDLGFSCVWTFVW